MTHDQNISNSSLAERSLHGKPVWAAHDFKACSCTAASRRPGTRGDKTHPNLAPPLAQRTVRRSRISKSKSDLVATWFGLLGGPFASWCSCCGFSGEDQKWFFCHSNCGSFVSRFAKSFALNSVFVWKAASVYPKIWFCQNIFLHNIHVAKVWFCQNIILPKYCFATISFCQNIILPKYHVLFCQNIIFPKYCDAKWSKLRKLSFAKYQFATICLQNDRPKSSQNNNLGRPQTPRFAQSPGVMVSLRPSSPVIATTSYPNTFQISILAWGDGSTGTIVLF